TTRFIKKLRAHYRFIVYQKKHRQTYQVPSIRAVLIETSNSDWAENLRAAARHKVISPNNAPLFWFTASAVFTRPVDTETSWPPKRPRSLAYHLVHPKVIFEPHWRSPADETKHSVLDLAGAVREPAL